MANYVLKELAEGMGADKGKSSLYPKMQIYTKFDYDKVVELTHSYSSTFSEGVIRGVIDALTTALKSGLSNGHSMKIDGLGVFSLSLGFCDEKVVGKSKKQKERYRHVCAKDINFKVDKELLQDINSETVFERATSEVVRYKKLGTTLEERRQRALELIRRQGYFTLSDYANENGLSRTMASGDLKRLTADPASGIIAKGSHSHKIWVGAINNQ